MGAHPAAAWAPIGSSAWSARLGRSLLMGSTDLGGTESSRERAGSDLREFRCYFSQFFRYQVANMFKVRLVRTVLQ